MKHISPIDALIVAACTLYGVRRADLLDGRRYRAVSLCRQQIIGALPAARQWSHGDIANLLGVDESSVVRARQRHVLAVSRDAIYRQFAARLARVIEEETQ